MDKTNTKTETEKICFEMRDDRIENFVKSDVTLFHGKPELFDETCYEVDRFFSWFLVSLHGLTCSNSLIHTKIGQENGEDSKILVISQNVFEGRPFGSLRGRFFVFEAKKLIIQINAINLNEFGMS